MHNTILLSLLTMKARILLGDDHALILDGLRTALQTQYEIAGLAKDGRALVQAAEKLKPDLIVVDISMPLLNGFEAAKQIKKILPHAKVIFLSQHLNPAYLKQALKLGASGYVLKADATEELQEAINTVLHGRTYITPAFGEAVISKLWNRDGELSEETEGLTERQREILHLIVEGRANKEIADILHVSVKTVEFHRARIMTKMGVKTVAELTKAAIQQGLIPN
jgi:DNA-binding NarL/FixJ family response regulator